MNIRRLATTLIVVAKPEEAEEAAKRIWDELHSDHPDPIKNLELTGGISLNEVASAFQTAYFEHLGQHIPAYAR